MKREDPVVLASEAFFRSRGLDPSSEEINDHETLIRCDLPDGQLVWHVDSRLPNFCRVDRVFYDEVYKDSPLRDDALHQITVHSPCLKAWGSEDTVVVCFESILSVGPGRLAAGIPAFSAIVSLLEASWNKVQTDLESALVETPHALARQFIERLENDLRGLS